MNINGRENRKTIEKVSKTKGWFFEKINNIDEPTGRLTKEERIQISKIRLKRGDITTNIIEIKGIIRKYYEQ